VVKDVRQKKHWETAEIKNTPIVSCSRKWCHHILDVIISTKINSFVVFFLIIGLYQDYPSLITLAVGMYVDSASYIFGKNYPNCIN